MIYLKIGDRVTPREYMSWYTGHIGLVKSIHCDASSFARSIRVEWLDGSDFYYRESSLLRLEDPNELLKEIL